MCLVVSNLRRDLISENHKKSNSWFAIFLCQPSNDRRCKGKYFFLIWPTYITYQNVVDI